MNSPLVQDVTMIDASACPRPARRRRALIVVLAGIDGAGKSTAGRLLARQLVAAGRPAIYMMNPCGRSRMIAWSDRLGLKVPSSLQDAAETTIRCVNVLVSQLRAAYFPGIVIMDRYLYCQLALKRVKGLDQGQLLPWLLRFLPRPDVVFYFDVPADLALARILKRATDTEDLKNLQDFDQGYRELDDFPSFVRINAGSSLEQIVDDLWRELAATGRVPQG